MAFSLRPMDGVFYEVFNEMAVHLVGGSALLAEMLAEGTDRAARPEMRDAESVPTPPPAPSCSVNETFVTPFDREDIYALAYRLDDAMDGWRSPSTCSTLYEHRRPSHELRQAGPRAIQRCAR